MLLDKKVGFNLGLGCTKPKDEPTTEEKAKKATAEAKSKKDNFDMILEGLARAINANYLIKKWIKGYERYQHNTIMILRQLQHHTDYEDLINLVDDIIKLIQD